MGILFLYFQVLQKPGIRVYKINKKQDFRIFQSWLV